MFFVGGGATVYLTYLSYNILAHISQGQYGYFTEQLPQRWGNIVQDIMQHRNITDKRFDILGFLGMESSRLMLIEKNTYFHNYIDV